MINYTKGVWKRIYVPEAHQATIAAVGLDSNHAIATINKKSFPDEWEANAQLIAAAPLLYEALKLTRDNLQTLSEAAIHYKKAFSANLEILNQALAR